MEVWVCILREEGVDRGLKDIWNGRGLIAKDSCREKCFHERMERFFFCVICRAFKRTARLLSFEKNLFHFLNQLIDKLFLLVCQRYPTAKQIMLLTVQLNSITVFGKKLR